MLSLSQTFIVSVVNARGTNMSGKKTRHLKQVHDSTHRIIVNTLSNTYHLRPHSDAGNWPYLVQAVKDGYGARGAWLGMMGTPNTTIIMG